MRRGWRAGSLLLGILLLTGCAGPGPDTAPTPDPAPGAGNATDVMFLQMLLEQHDRAAELLRLAAARAVRPEVRTLAAALEATQRTEARTMTDWLRDWGRPRTADPAAHATVTVTTGHTAHSTDASATADVHHAHGGYDVLRGTTAADVDLLAATGADEFDRTLLNILIAHQHNAVELARMQAAGGTLPAVTRFARQVERSRTAQVEHMLSLLAQV